MHYVPRESAHSLQNSRLEVWQHKSIWGQRKERALTVPAHYTHRGKGDLFGCALQKMPAAYVAAVFGALMLLHVAAADNNMHGCGGFFVKDDKLDIDLSLIKVWYAFPYTSSH